MAYLVNSTPKTHCDSGQTTHRDAGVASWRLNRQMVDVQCGRGNGSYAARKLRPEFRSGLLGKLMLVAQVKNADRSPTL